MKEEAGQFEYMVVSGHHHPVGEKVRGRLINEGLSGSNLGQQIILQAVNQLAEKGWELINIVSVEGSREAWLKRRTK